MKNLILASLLTLSSMAFATDANNFKNLGFSADGRYYAFVESVIQDGSGFPAAYGQVIDVTMNKVVSVKRVVIEDDRVEEREAIRQVVLAINPKRFGIDGRNPGKTLWIRVANDLSAPVKSALFSPNYYVDAGSSSVSPKLNLEVGETLLPTQEKCLGFSSAKIRVDLQNLTAGTSILLQEDSHLPSRRDCASNYQIRQVLTHNKAIAAVLRFETPGFEGPNYQHMVVTASQVIEE